MGLYDDDDAAITSGDQNNEDYWWSKYYSVVLDEALKSKQPEGAIRGFLKDYALVYHDKALAKYAQHNDVKAWKAKAEKINSKVDPNSSGYFQPNFAWFGGPGGSGGGNFGHWWVSYHWAKCAMAAGDWETAYEKAKYCSFRKDEVNDERFCGKYGDDIKAFLKSSAEDNEANFVEIKKHR